MDCRFLSFPDSAILRWDFNSEHKTLFIDVDEAIYDDDTHVRQVDAGTLKIRDWSNLHVHGYSADSPKQEPLQDLIDVHFDSDMVRLRGLGQSSMNMVDWIFTAASYQFEPKS